MAAMIGTLTPNLLRVFIYTLSLLKAIMLETVNECMLSSRISTQEGTSTILPNNSGLALQILPEAPVAVVFLVNILFLLLSL